MYAARASALRLHLEEAPALRALSSRLLSRHRKVPMSALLRVYGSARRDSTPSRGRHHLRCALRLASDVAHLPMVRCIQCHLRRMPLDKRDIRADRRYRGICSSISFAREGLRRVLHVLATEDVPACDAVDLAI